MDPAGIVDKMDHFLKTNKHIYEAEVKALAPNATPTERNNLENLVEVSQALNIYYKVIRHYYLLGKKTMNIYVIMQVHMILPQLVQMVEAYASGIQAFQEGMPIGDSVGAIVAAKLMHGYPQRDIAEEIVAAEVPYEGRTLVVFKAKGPGGSVGNPDEGLINVLEERQGKVKIIITVDAAGKLEGEPVGQVSEGIGAAIGGSGKEKFKMEEVTNRYKIPMHAIAIKQGMEHVVAPLIEPLFDATDKAVESVKRIVTRLHGAWRHGCCSWDRQHHRSWSVMSGNQGSTAPAAGMTASWVAYAAILIVGLLSLFSLYMGFINYADNADIALVYLFIGAAGFAAIGYMLFRGKPDD